MPSSGNKGCKGYKMGTKLVILSLDAMIAEDLPILAKHPVFSELFQEGALVREVRSIYPTLTYPCHTTMVTGNLPDRHGVTANSPLCPGVDPLPWFFYHDVVRSRDIFDAAKEAGMTTAAVGWPVTGNHPSIDYLVDEIWPVDRKMTPKNLKAVLLGSGTSEEIFEEIVKPLVPLRLPRTQPNTAIFSTGILSGMIRKYRPDVLAIHLAQFDHYRHKLGVHGPLIERGAAELAENLAEIEDALRANGDLETCNIVITSDHGQIDCQRIARPNVLLREHGFISVDEKGRVTDWRAYAVAVGMSVQIWLRDPADKALYDEVYDFLKGIVSKGTYGYSEVLTTEETEARDHLSGGFSFILETDGITHFSDGWTGEYMKPDRQFLEGFFYGSHGYHPDKGPKMAFIGKGPAFRKGAVLDAARLEDQAPTYARILDVSLPDTDGRVMEELLR